MNKASRATPPSNITQGTVVAIFGRRLEVEDETGPRLDYVSHGN